MVVGYFNVSCTNRVVILTVSAHKPSVRVWTIDVEGPVCVLTNNLHFPMMS